MNTSTTVHTIGFGGGCHWCTEAVFQALRGVLHVEQGWIAADPPDDVFSEAVCIRFDPARISLGELIEVHLATHSSRSNHSMRRKYRSAIYTNDRALAEEARRVLAMRSSGERTMVTRVLALRSFHASRPEITNYYQTDPSRPFCQTFIEPKLELLRTTFPKLLR